MISKNQFVFGVFMFSYVLCTFLVGAIKFSFLDEILILALTIYTFLFIIFKYQITKSYFFFLFVVLFYALHSFCLAEIDKRAIVADILQQLKPFLVFFNVYQLNPQFDAKQKKIIKNTALTIVPITFVIFLFYYDTPHEIDFFPHIAVYGQIMFTTALLYFYSSERTKKDIFIFLIIIILGLYCGRSKYYGEFLFAIICLWKINSPVKFTFKYTFLSVVSIVIILLAVWTKFNSYFIEGIDSEDMARPILYNTSVVIAQDYFPLGSGFGSFAVDASKVWYSPIYDKYGISNVWGLSRDYDEFVADTFFPVIVGQFGVVGIILFFLFWRFIVVKLNHHFTSLSVKYEYNIALIIVVLILIESVAGPMFVTTYAITPIMLLAVIISDLKNSKIDKSLIS